MIKEATDLRFNVTRRNSVGGPAPIEVIHMIGDRHTWFEATKLR